MECYSAINKKELLLCWVSKVNPKRLHALWFCLCNILKIIYFVINLKNARHENGCLMRRTDSLEKTLMLGGIGGRRRRE